MISTLATCNPSCPVNLWEDFLPQMEITLNVLRPSPVNPAISCYEQMCGKPFDFNSHPIAPCGTKVAIYEGPQKRTTWGAHALAGYYVGPVVTGYRMFKVFVVATEHIRVSDSLAWFSPYTIPGSSVAEIIVSTITDFSNALKDITALAANPSTVLTNTQMSLAKNLTDLVQLFVKDPNTESAVYPKIVEEPIIPDKPDVVGRARVHFAPENQSEARSINVPVQMRGEPSLRVEPLSEINTVPPLRVEPVAATVSEQIKIVPPLRVEPIQIPITASPIVEPIKEQRGKKQPISKMTTRSTTKFEAPVLPHSIVARYACAAKTQSLLPQVLLSSLDEEAVKAMAATLRYVDPTAPKWHDCMKSPERDIWIACNDAELRRLITVTKTMSAIPYADMPKDRKASYYNPQCTEKPKLEGLRRRVRDTIGGDQIDYAGDVTAFTASLPDFKILLKPFVSTAGARFMTVDIIDYYLQTPLETPEYMMIHRRFISPAIEEEFKLHNLWHNDQIYFKVVKGIYGLPQAGILAQKQLFPRLRHGGFISSPDNPCLFKHHSLPIFFVLTVDDFGVKYNDKADAQHLIDTLSPHYDLTIDWEGKKYLGMTIEHDPVRKTLALSMPGYVGKALCRFRVPVPKRRIDAPAYCPPPNYSKAQLVDPEDMTEPLRKEEITHIQQVIGVFLYYARCIDITAITTLNKMSKQLAKPTHRLIRRINYFLAYMASHPNAKLIFRASDMQLCVHSDASYLSEPDSRSRAGGFHWLGSDLPYNGAVDVLTTTIKAVVSAASEAEYGAAFLNATQALPTIRSLNFLGFEQFQVTVTMDNSTACGVANRTVKPRRSKAMDMRFNWIKDREAQKQFKFVWAKGSSNLADYFTKTLSAKEYKVRRHMYVDN